jgi:osmotically inducible protein OsmC
MTIKRHAQVRWEGDLKSGHGELSTPASGVLVNQRIGFNSRFAGERGTNPEELIAAAHASCFSMALSAKLTEAGHPPAWIETRAEISMEMDGGPHITGDHLLVRANVPGLDAAGFEKIAQDAKANCPVSKALSIPITMDAALG